MSYDIWLDSEDVDGNAIEVGSWNYTANCAPMWRRAGADLAGFAGKLASEVAPVLEEAIACLKANPQDYLPMNPSNGWGSYETLLQALEQLLGMLRKHPSARVRVSR